MDAPETTPREGDVEPIDKVAVLGAGSWGTTVASMIAMKAPTVLWARKASLAEEIRRDHTNHTYTGPARLTPSLDATGDLACAVDGASFVVMAVPSHGFRAIVNELRAYARPSVPVISLTKGLEHETLARMTQIVTELDPGRPVALVTGPNLAAEVLEGQPTASVVAASDQHLARRVQWLLHSRSFRLYTNPDIVGCEMAGCLKNVMAIAAGMSDGLGFGDNTRAALMTRGLAEMGRLGYAMGGHPLTFAGLAGMGDLVATCTSPKSRNHHVGIELGRGRKPAEVLGEMTMVAEGVKTAPVAVELGESRGVPMPISTVVARVLVDQLSAQDALEWLLSREVGDEMAGIR